MAASPAVTVIVASYNYEHYLGEALQSALDQIWSDFELVVVDDGSQDGSLELARAFAARDARVRVLSHADGKNHGLPATLALGIAQARGRFIAFLESDDRWLPQCLSLRMKTLERTGAGVVFNDIEPLAMPGVDTAWFDGYVGRVMKEHADRAQSPARGTQRAHAAPDNGFFLQTEFLTENKIPTFSCAMVKSELLRACSMDAPVPRWLDWWVWAQLAQKTDFAFVPVRLTQWRLHRASQHNAIIPLHYLRDYRAMWHGFRRQLTQGNAQDTQTARILRMPFWSRILTRFYMIAREFGVKDTMQRIFGRLGWNS